MKKLDKYSDFYSIRLKDYQTWPGGDLQQIMIRPNYAIDSAENCYCLRLLIVLQIEKITEFDERDNTVTVVLENLEIFKRKHRWLLISQ